MSAQCIVVLVSVQILLYELPCLAFHMSLLVNIINQGPRRNFEIGGGGTICDSILGGAQDTFSYQVFIILKILGGGTCPHLLHDPC